MATLDKNIGRRFGHWTVLGHTAEPGAWLCRCSCGRVRIVSFATLSRGRGTGGCGCRSNRYKYTGPPPSLKIILPPVGRRFGRWTVLGLGQRRFHWLCRCDCGTQKEVHRNHLKGGASRSCGCRQTEELKEHCRQAAEKRFQKHFAGRRFGHLIVLKRQDKRHWLCRCDCGVQRLLERRYVLKAAHPSCGCQQKRSIGKRFGRWTVLAYGKQPDTYRCRCDCGTVREIGTSSLYQGQSRSCGCLKSEQLAARNKTLAQRNRRLAAQWKEDSAGDCSASPPARSGAAG